jgi:hypothetical protein
MGEEEVILSSLSQSVRLLVHVAQHTPRLKEVNIKFSLVFRPEAAKNRITFSATKSRKSDSCRGVD